MGLIAATLGGATPPTQQPPKQGGGFIAQKLAQTTPTQPSRNVTVLPTSRRGEKKPVRESRNFPGMKESFIERFVLNPLFGNSSNFVVKSGQNIGEGLATLDPNVRKYANAPGVLGSSGQTRVRDVAALAGKSALDLASFATSGAGAALGATAKTAKTAGLGRAVLQGAKVGGAYGSAAGATQALEGKQKLFSGESAKKIATSGAIGAASGAALAGVLGGLSKVAANRAAKKLAITPEVRSSFNTPEKVRAGIRATVDDVRMMERTKQSDPALWAQMVKTGQATEPNLATRARDIATKMEAFKPGLGQKFMKQVKLGGTVDDIAKQADDFLNGSGFAPAAKVADKIDDPLLTEARKYKSAEEFANGGTSVFRGGKPTDVTRGGKVGISVSTDKAVADRFARYNKGVSEELRLSPSAKVLDANNITARQIGADRNEANIIKYARDNGYDAVDFTKSLVSAPELKGTYLPESEIRVLNADVLKTKSQLTDIWKKAQGVATPQGDPIARITQALKDAKPIRESQEKLYSKIRSERLGKALAMGQKVKGEKGFYAQLGALKGELPKAQFESLRKTVSQDDLNQIMERLRTSPRLTGYKQITAQQAMLKLFAQEGGDVPTRSELSLLQAEFGDDFVKTVLEKRPLLQKLQEAGIQALNLPRAMMATGDLSAPLRQGIFMTSKPKQFLPAFLKMFKYAASEKAYKNLMDDIAKRPTYGLMEKNNLALTGMDDALTNREEAFISNWSEKIPLFGKLARASNRAYSGFLNKVRVDVFDDLVRQAQKQGVNLDDNPEVARNIARLVNAGTGRGELPTSIAKHATALNGIFFSPRLMASRLQLMNPVFYAKMDPFTRKQALSMLVKAVGGAGTILGLAKAGGADVGTDPRSADFGKIKLGNTRVDMLGGFQQYIKLAAQLMTGQVVSSTTGKVITLGEGYKPMTRLDIIGRFLEAKEAPLPSFFTSLIRGQNSIGQQFNVPEEIASRFYPILWGDLKDLYAEQGPAMGTALTTLAMLGSGVQTYGPGMPGTTTSKEADKVLAEAKYQPPEVTTSLTNPKNDEVIKLKGDEAKQYKKEIMEAVVKGISKARRHPRWEGLSKDEKYDEVKSEISKEKAIVNKKWRRKKFDTKETSKAEPLLNKILGIKTASAATIPKAKDNTDKVAAVIATIEGYKKSGTLADRQKNPGNLRFVGQKNATQGDKRFAKFKTHQDGWNALRRQIQIDAGRGLTLRQFVYKYAPPSENNSKAYLNTLVREIGAKPDSKLSQVIR